VNLKLYLTLRIALLAFLCLVLASGYVLWQAQREQQRAIATTLSTMAKQLQIRLTSVQVGFDRVGRFLYWDPLVDSEIASGYCVRYEDAQGRTVTSSCGGFDPDEPQASTAPFWFDSFFRAVFDPAQETAQPLTWRKRDYGQLVATPDATIQVARAWHAVRSLMGLTAVTVLALCVLVCLTIDRALRPTREILRGLERLEHGDLAARLPAFELIELRKLSNGLNRLAASLEQSIAERAELTRRLVSVQEEERRHLARELHDEFGQCLAAINAAAASVGLTARQKCPELESEAERLNRITDHMMQMLRSMLLRLRPPGFDELGLIESLRGLVAEWNGRSARIDLDVQGDFERLPEPVTIGIFRIVQECLTNVAKHADATRVSVRLERRPTEPRERTAGEVDVIVEDDGRTGTNPFAATPGLGLLGMRERVTALGGQLTLREPDRSRGLVVHAQIPIAVPA
jgi:two-component system sensor histidine kinase UhpB